MRKRILVCEPDPDVRSLLEISIEKLGHDSVCADGGDVDVVLMEPACAVARAQLRRFGRLVPPVVCISTHPRESLVAPPETVAYLMKPIRQDRLRAALARALAA